MAGGGEAQWPKRQELQRLIEEDNIAEGLESIRCASIADLCRRLGTDPQDGLPDGVPDFDRRVEVFGGNWFAEKKRKAYWEFAFEAVQDKILLLLLAIGTIELVIKMAFVPEERSEGWIEPLAIYVTVLLIVNVQSTLDYKRDRLFENLSKKLAASNIRFVVRSGKQVSLTDEKIVVGDILAFNAHMAATIPCDGVLISGEGVKTDESALTGEPEPIKKDEHKPFLISGTQVNAGQGKMLVIAVGEHSVSGKIKKAVYDDEGAEESPLFQKLDTMAEAVGRAGTFVAAVVFVITCIQGFGVHHAPAREIIEFILIALGILAVAVPEGLPLALTIALAISSNKMSDQNNLVKTLDSCETMGSVTTICTDKTGTLTANRMTVRACYLGGMFFHPDNQNHTAVGPRVKQDTQLGTSVKELIGNLIAVCTMDESQISAPTEGGSEPKFHGNPTECAMLKFAEDCGFSYQAIRTSTEGRNEATRGRGSAKAFSSARKMMSWAVPKPEGGFRVYAKGASEIILSRVVAAVDAHGGQHSVSQSERAKIEQDVVAPFADQAFRTIGMAYRDMDDLPGEELHDTITNTDGSKAYLCETDLVLIGVLGIADPLRPEVPGAIAKCYAAGIDVRMVTGDNLATAIAIAKGAGILNEKLHLDANGKVKPFRAMEGKTFRAYVHKYTPDGDPIFQQDKFDEIWPFLRVLARSSPEDKLTLAKGLSGSMLYTRKADCARIKREEDITIFPDRQVIAMTGDGTNDAPALKAADVGFAMGISGTQIAKDAANIILLDDNFASIVTAAKWGRNVFDCIQKFLQFQLTVNIAILVIQLIISFTGKDPPLKLLHMLWLNMIMDSLASIAMSSEPPVEAQLQRPPVNRSEFIINPFMWWNMLGQATYQIIVSILLLMKGHHLPGCNGEMGPNSKQYTIIFTVFVFMQLFNFFNCRFLLGEFNIIKGLRDNPSFLTITFVCMGLQVLMTQFAGPVLEIHPQGLDGTQWGISLALGAGPLLWQPLINIAKMVTDHPGFWRCSERNKIHLMHTVFTTVVFLIVFGICTAF